MSNLPVSLDDLDFAFETPADSDIGEPVDGYEYDLVLSEDVMCFDASDMARSAPHEGVLVMLHSKLDENELLELWMRLEVTKIEAATPSCGQAARPNRRSRRVIDQRQLALF
ncbi:hypothetical protein ACG04R_16455 [Roseateles sp. BYS78W]|uniref:Uncharacterized protein n=1 Tax=Pelomonas candidula TaxID=3299025 RepID=A0ABW7HEE0_9BURK